MRHLKAQTLLKLARHLASSAEGLTLDQMAETAEVGRRSAERMRDALQILFPYMEEVIEGQVKRFRISGGLDAFLQTPTAEELLTLVKTAKGLRDTGNVVRASELESLFIKIQASMRGSALRRVAPDLEALINAEFVAVQAGPHSMEDEEVLGTLREAIKAIKGVRFTYAGGRTPGAVRKVAPYGLIFGRSNYLVGAELGDLTPRTWRLDRISKIVVINVAAPPPRDFSLAEFATRSFGMYHSDPADVVLRIKDGRTTWRFHPKQVAKLQSDGSSIVTFAAGGMHELASHLCGWGDKIEILEPPHLRDLVVQALEAALAAHRSSPSAAPKPKRRTSGRVEKRAPS